MFCFFNEQHIHLIFKLLSFQMTDVFHDQMFFSEHTVCPSNDDDVKILIYSALCVTTTCNWSTAVSGNRQFHSHYHCRWTKCWIWLMCLRTNKTPNPQAKQCLSHSEWPRTQWTICTSSIFNLCSMGTKTLLTVTQLDRKPPTHRHYCVDICDLSEPILTPWGTPSLTHSSAFLYVMKLSRRHNNHAAVLFHLYRLSLYNRETLIVNVNNHLTVFVIDMKQNSHINSGTREKWSSNIPLIFF